MLRTLITLCIASICIASPLSAAGGKMRAFGKLDTKALEILMRSDHPPVILDARKPRYDDGRRIGAAALMPSGSSPHKVAQAVPTKNTLIVTYCSNMRCPLAHELAEQLIKMGYRNVLVYPYGLKGWSDAGLSIHADDQ